MRTDTPRLPAFDAPVELLLACHDKVRRFAALCPLLAQHTALHGADEQARSAAASILRYFTIAAPLHHADEEDDLFPALRALHNERLTATMHELASEHDALNALWRRAQPWLAAVAQGAAGEPPPALSEFACRYAEHARREEREVFPVAARLSEHTLRDIGARMAQRRGA